MSTRSTIDQVILSAILRSMLLPEILCALHRAIVTSVLFPAAIAVIPHILRILERDSGSNWASVRDSAARGLAELERIVHPRLPAQRGPVIQRGREGTTEEEQEEEEEVEVLNSERSEDMVLEERIVEDVPAVQENPTPESLKSAIEREPQTKEIRPSESVPSLPSFVNTIHTNPQSAITSSRVMTGNDGPILQTETSLSTISMAAKRRTENRLEDVFNTGAWKQIKIKDLAEEEDTEDEIPEIDMDFDSDEE